MPEISESELQEFDALRKRLQKVYSNPKARMLAEQAYKVVEPGAATPTVDEENQRLAPVKELSDRFDAWTKGENERREKEANDKRLSDFAKNVDDQYAQLRGAGWTQEGIDGVKKIAEEKALMPLDAAAIFERDHPPQPVGKPGGYGGPWNFMDPPAEDASGKNLKSLIESKGDNELVLNKLIQDGLSDVRGPSLNLRR